MLKTFFNFQHLLLGPRKTYISLYHEFLGVPVVLSDLLVVY